jgi:hypothetical protein
MQIRKLRVHKEGIVMINNETKSGSNSPMMSADENKTGKASQSANKPIQSTDKSHSQQSGQPCKTNDAKGEKPMQSKSPNQSKS